MRLAFAALALCLAARGVPACPLSPMSFSPGDFSVDVAVFDSATTFIGVVGARTAFSIPAGTVEVYHCCNLLPGYTRVRDAFDVSGVPAGTPVTVVAELAVEGWVFSAGCGGSGCAGYLDASVSAGTTSQQVHLLEHIFGVSRVPVNALVQLPVTIVAGQPVIVEFQLSAGRTAGGNHGAEGTGHIRFTGLPSGAAIVSCNGYGSAVVPTRSPSWGRLKTIYR